jgi:hypothetical protein
MGRPPDKPVADIPILIPPTPPRPAGKPHLPHSDE